MVSKNNHAIQMQEVAERQPHFGIRKLTIGVASVLLSTTLWLSGTTSSVHAETTDSGNGEDKATDESNTQTQSIDNNTQVVVQTDGSNSSADQKVETNNNENTPSEGLETNADSSAVQSTTKETPESGSTSQSTDRSAQSVSQSSTQNAGQANQGTSSVNNTNSNTNITQNNSTETSINNKVDSSKKTNSTSNEKNTTTTNSQNNSAETTIENKSDGLDQNATDLSKTGLTGITAKNVPDTSNLLENNVVTTNSKENNEVNVNQISGLRAAQLFASSFIEDQTTGTDGGAVDLSTYTPDFNFKNTNDTIDGHVIYTSYTDKANGTKWSFATDSDNPGQTIYLYKNGSLADQLSANNSGNTTTVTVTPGVTGGVYTGGKYTFHISGSNKGGIAFSRLDVTGEDGTVINSGSTADITQGSGTLVMGDGKPGTWQSGGGEVPTQARQTIWYVDATNGKILGHKESDATISGSTYDDTDAQLPEITVDGKTYKLIKRTDQTIQVIDKYTLHQWSNSNPVPVYKNKTENIYSSDDLKQDVVLTTNNGVQIKASDLLGIPLTGNISHSRIGDIGITNTGYAVKTTTGSGIGSGDAGKIVPDQFYITQQLDAKGDVELNSYSGAGKALNTDGNLCTKELGTYVPMYYMPKNTLTYDNETHSAIGDNPMIPGPGVAIGYNTMFVNGGNVNNQDVIILYTPDNTKPTPTPDETTGQVEYIDDSDNNKVLRTDPLKGKVGENIDYTTQDKITDYKNIGYKLVSNDFKDGNEIFDKDASNNKFEVHLEHDIIPVTPDNPSGHDTKNLTKTVTRTIHYEYDDDKSTAAPDKEQTLTFNGTAYYDKAQKAYVTGPNSTTLANQDDPAQSWTVQGGTTDSGTFGAVKSPTTENGIKAGYTATRVTPGDLGDGSQNINVIAQGGITHATPNSDVTVYYNKKTPETPTTKQGTIEITYHDTTYNLDIPGYGEPQTKEDEGTSFSYNPNAKDLPALENKGYVLDTNYKFPTIPTKYTDGDQPVVIYVKHGTRTVDPDHPANPKDPVDPNHSGTPTPSNPNLSKTDLEKPITRTIKYQYANGTKAHDDSVQTVNFTGKGTIDLVTGNLVNVDSKGNILDQNGKINWTPSSQDFGAVKAIDHDGYRISKVEEKNSSAKVSDDTAVSAETVTPSDLDSTIIITLDKKPETPSTPVAANGSITYTDDTTGNMLEEAAFNGNVGDKIQYTTKDRIDHYVAEGYKLVSNDFTDGTQVYNSDNQKNIFHVHLIHTTVPVNPDEPGTPGSKLNPKDPRPNGPKYPDGTNKESLTKTITRTINYVGDGLNIQSKKQDLTFTASGVLDKVTGQWVTADKDGNVTGSAEGMTWTLQNSDKDSGDFTEVAGPDSTVDAPNGTKGYRIDKITTNNEEPSDVNSQTGAVNAKTINHANGDIVITIHYAKNPEPAKDEGSIDVKVHDVHTGQDVPGYEENSNTQPVDTPFTYPTKDNIDKLTKAGYKVLNPDIQIPDKISKGDQHFVIYVDHTIIPVTPDKPGNGLGKDVLTKTVKENIKYVVTGDQSKNPADHNASLTFNGTAYYDSVTKKWTDAQGNELKDQTQNITWTAQDGNKFDTVISPVVTGYHVTNVSDGYNDGNGNVKEVPGINQKSNDINVVVTYNKDAEPTKDQGSLAVNVHDVTIDKDVPGYDKQTGTQDVGYNFDFNKDNTIKDLEGKGYKVLNPDITIPTQVTKGDHTYTIYVQHNIIPVTPDKPGNGLDHDALTKTVTETVHYVVEGNDANKPAAPADKNASLTFNGTGYYDAVTKKWTDADGKELSDQSKNLTWTAQDGNKFAVVVTPSLDGYTPSVQEGYDDGNKNVKEIDNINQNSKNVDVTVTYTKNPNKPITKQGTIEITYHDNTDNVDLPGYGEPQTKEDEGTSFSYNPNAKDIPALENKGYVLDGNLPTIPTKYTDGDQHVIIYMKHGTRPVDPDHPANPKDPVDPTHPGTPTPSDPNLSKTDLEKDVTRTVKYQYEDGSKAHDDSVQTVNFKGHGVIDLVTGNLVDVDKDGKILDQRGKITWDHDSQNLDPVKAIDHDGYYVSGVSETGTNAKVTDTAVAGETVTPTSQNSTIIITLTKNPDKPTEQSEKANLHIIDITDGNKNLGNFTASGEDNTAINFNGAQTTVDSLIKAGYKINSIKHTDKNAGVITDAEAKQGEPAINYGNIASQWKFDNLPGTDQEFDVYLVHDYTPINPNNSFGRTDLTKTVKETVHYVDEATGKSVASDYTDTATFTGKGLVDKVTGKMLAIQSRDDKGVTYDYDVKKEIDIDKATPDDFVWSASVTLPKAASPTIPGYEVDASKTTPADLAEGNDIKAIENVGYDHADINATVYYKATPQEVHKAELSIYANDKLAGTASVDGAKDTPINFGAASDIVSDLISQGYKFDHAQDLTNNQKMNGSSYSELNFGNFSEQNNSDQKFAIYLTKDVAPEKTQQNAQLTIKDVTPGQEQDLGNYTQPGLEGDAISFGDAQQFVQSLLDKGYVWDGASYNGTNLDAKGYSDIKFGNYDNTDDKNSISQKWVINLVHGYTPVNPDHPDKKDGFTKEYLDRTITRTVNYVDENGNEMPGLTPEKQTAHYEGSGYLDNVTHRWVNVVGNKITGLSTGLIWTPNEDTKFDAIGPKSATGYKVISVSGTGISGFTVGKDGSVTEQNVNRNTPSSVITVVYGPQDKTPATGSITYTDDTTGTVLEKAGFNGAVGDKIDYTTADRIAYYENKGYDLVSNDFKDGEETFAKEGNIFNVHLVHATTPITPDKPGKPGEEVPNPKDPQHPHKIPDNFVPQDLKKTVTRDVTYVYEDGTQADTPVHQTFTFEGQGVIDLVTGQLVNVENGKITGAGKITWNAENHDFDATKSIDTKNYQIVGVKETNTNANVDWNNGVVAKETITPANQNSSIVITLAKKQPDTPVVNKGTVVINYIDKTTGSTLETANATGSEGTEVNYSTKDTIDKYINEGYKLEHDGYPTTTVTFTKGTQTYEVDLVHDTVPVNPDKPGKPGEPINPNDPNGPKYPDDTDAKNLTKTITRTINYVGDGLNIPSSHSEVQFVASGVLDKVTGQWTTPLTWTVKGGNADSSEFAQVTGPKVDGYKITNISSTNEDISDVDKDTGTVAGKTINHTNGNIVITINYTKSQTPAQAENADLHIIDITDNNKELGKFNDSGADNSAINFNGAQTTIDALIKGGYKVNSIVQATSDPNNPTKYGTDYATASSQWKFDDKPGTDQAFYVYVEHDYAPINPENAYGRTDLTKTVTETVHYLDEDTNKQVATDYTNKVTFTGQGRVDKVTGKMLKIKSIDDKGITYDYNVDDEIDIKDAKLSDFAWSTPTTLNKVESPTIDGYKVDSSKTTPADLADGDGIKAIQNVGYDHANIEATVYYKKSETPTPDTVTGKITYYDDTTGSTLDSDSFTGHVGDKITYTTQDKIDSYEDKGYNLVSNNFKDGDETFAKDGNTFEVHLVHATTTITPDKPGKPGDEVPNPSDPKHPHKIPDSFVPQTLTHTVTRDVSYVYDDGTKAPDPVHQSFTFTGQGVVDLVTGQLVNVDKDGKITGAGKITWNADSHDFEATKEIKHDGYNIVGVDETNTNAKVDRTTGVVAGQTVTPTSQNSTVVITLSKKPAPTEEQGSIKVTIHDVRTGQDIPGYGKDSGTQKAGTDFSFDKTTTIQDLEKHGYKVLNPDIEIPTKIGDTDQNFVINVDHNIIPVTPDKPGNGLTKDDLEKTVTETIHYVVNGGDATAPADKTVDLKFNGTGYYDAVTGKWTDAQGNELKDQTKNITWTAENGDKFAEVDTPVIKGYTPTVSDGYGDSNNNVKEIDNITPATKDITVTVTYNPTEPTQPTKKQGSITVIVHDDTNNTDIYNYSTGKVDEGTQVPFNHANMDKYLTDHGYEIVKDPEIPSTVGDSDQTYVIHVTKKQNPEPTPQPTQSPEPQPTQAPSSTPSKPTPTPQPSAPTQPTQPSKQPSEPNEPDEPDEPDVPETPRKPHEHKRHETPSKPSHRTPAPTPTRNVTPRPQNNYWSNNVSPHGQGIGGGYNNNVAPHGQTVNGWNGNVGPNGEHVDSNGNIVAPNGQIIGYVDKNGNPHYTTLPQTGEDKTDETAAVLGGLAASLGLLGLAGVRKRREDK